MHNLPTNNETNIIRNIFNVSTQLNESKKASLRPINELADVTEKEINAISDPDLRAKVMAQHQETQKVKANTASLEAEAGRLKQETERVASGEPSQEYKNFVAGVPGGKPREGASAFARADYAARQREAEDKAASDVRRAKEAEESKARVKAWQSSPEYQKQVEADRAKAAAKKAAREAANVVSQREQPESTAAKVDTAITTAATAVGLPKVGEVVSGALGIDAASRREAALAAEGEKARKHYETETSKPEYIARQTEDPRMLPQLVAQGKISQEEAEKKLQQHFKLRGGHDDITQHVEKRLKDLRATPPAPTNPSTQSTSVSVPKPAATDTSKERPNISWDSVVDAWDEFWGNKKPMKESYYRRLANLFEETSDQPISGVNPAAYGYTPKGQRKARLAAKGFAEPMKSWAGDSTVEAPDLEPESTERPHIDTVVAPHIETLVRAAAQNELDLSHGEAFDPRSKDHQRLIIKTKDPEVMKASEAIRQIRKDYGMED